MLRRYGMFLLLTLWVGGSGCASSARRTDGMPLAGGLAWSEPPAPPQRTLSPNGDSPGGVSDSPNKTEGLSKYFPGLARNTTASTNVAGRPWPTLFGLRSKPVPSQLHTTDARVALDKKVAAEPTTLPVALQVPSQRATTDQNVTPTGGVATTANSLPPRVFDLGVSKSPDNSPAFASYVPEFGGRPSMPGEDEVNPLPPAAEPGTMPPGTPPTAVIANQMPVVPPVDPLNAAPARNPVPRAAGPREPAIPAAYVAQASSATAQAPAPSQQNIHTWKPYPTSQVFPSPQVAPTAKAKTVSMPKPSPQVSPTSQAKATPQVTASTQPKTSPQTQVKPSPSPQVAASPQSDDVCSECGAHIKKRPCLRRLIRKVFKMGEYDSPPTAAPH